MSRTVGKVQGTERDGKHSPRATFPSVGGSSPRQAPVSPAAVVPGHSPRLTGDYDLTAAELAYFLEHQ